MDGHTWSRLLLLAALLSSVAAKSVPVYVVVGEPLVLTPSGSGPLSSIVWDLNGNLVAEWVKSDPAVESDLEFYRSFKGRANLNLATGQLVIENTTGADSGLFKVTINNVKQSLTYQAQVIKRVPEPEVQMRTLTCSPDSSSCTLTCSGDATGAGAVTYSWRKGTGPWGPETISCRMTNPVGMEESEPLENLLYKDPPPGHVVGMVLGVLSGSKLSCSETSCLNTASVEPDL
uniref:Ig-like domain-containing protein n=1 Tax=Scophthalmus maximus TaxID=52904 RepID=A0A8D3BPR6_SCOMX